MKMLLKIVGALVGLVVVLALGGLGDLMLAFPNVPPPAVVTIEPTPERLARGKYLSDHVTGCTSCHSERDWTKFSGPVKPDRLGVGGQEFPLMPYPHFGAMAADDMHAILAYIRSWKAIEHQVPAPTDQVGYGKYMTRSALCGDCHTPIDDRRQPLPGKDFAGGLEFLETGYRVRSANITPDVDTGIGSWTEQQFDDKFKAFETPSDAVLSENERRQNTVMPMTAYAGMTREDLAAIYAYLRTLMPVVNCVTRFPDAR